MALVSCKEEGGTRPDALVADAQPVDADPNQCTVTADNIEGPFHSENAPIRTDIRTPGAAGVQLYLTGRVLDTDCNPMPGVLVDFWQADSSGGYDEQGQGFRGRQMTDENGRYELTTVVPGHYLNGNQFRPAHIHIKIGPEGPTQLTTQLYFPEDPYNEIDPWYEPGLQITTTDRPDGGKNGNYDFIV